LGGNFANPQEHSVCSQLVV